MDDHRGIHSAIIIQVGVMVQRFAEILYLENTKHVFSLTCYPTLGTKWEFLMLVLNIAYKCTFSWAIS